jgi:hypothetical protein
MGVLIPVGTPGMGLVGSRLQWQIHLLSHLGFLAPGSSALGTAGRQLFPNLRFARLTSRDPRAPGSPEL